MKQQQIKKAAWALSLALCFFAFDENIHAQTTSGDAPAKQGQKIYRETEVRFSNGKVELAGTLFLPESSAPFPAVVIIHGSGASDRTNPWTAAYAKALAQRGIAVLYPDKRGAGKSQGDWKTASFAELADDTIAGVRLLLKTEKIDKDRIGVIGFSQGGHIAPLAATRAPEIAFAVSVSSSTVPILEQISDELEMSSERFGLTEKQKSLIREINNSGIEYASTGKGWEKYHALLSNAKSGELKGQKIVEGFPSEPNHWLVNYIKALGNYDPLPFWEKMSQPSLFIYGGQDTNVRVGKSIRRIESSLGAGKRNYAVMLFQNNGHALFREDLLDFLARWVTDKGIG